MGVSRSATFRPKTNQRTFRIPEIGEIDPDGRPTQKIPTFVSEIHIFGILTISLACLVFFELGEIASV